MRKKVFRKPKFTVTKTGAGRPRLAAQKKVFKKTFAKRKLPKYFGKVKRFGGRKTWRKRTFRRKGGIAYGAKNQISKNFAMKIQNALYPFKKFKRTQMYSLYTSGNTVARHIFQVATFHHGDESMFTSNGILEINKYEEFTKVATTSYTDLAYARNNYWNGTGTTTQYGCKGQLNYLFKLLEIRNNTPLKAHIKLTYFIPRKGAAMSNLTSAYAIVANAIAQLPNGENVDAPNYDWRNNSVLNPIWKMVVKRFTLLPGATRWIKLKAGGLPFFGSNQGLDETTFSKRFFRWAILECYGDLTLGQTAVGEPPVNLPDLNKPCYGPCTLTIVETTKMGGKNFTNNAPAVNTDFTTVAPVTGPKWATPAFGQQIVSVGG